MHLVSACKEPSDGSSVQTFQFINLLSETRCQKQTHSYSNGLSNARHRVGIVSCIPIPLRMHMKAMKPLLLSPPSRSIIWFHMSLWPLK